MFEHLSQGKQWMSRNNGMIPLNCRKKMTMGLEFCSQKKIFFNNGDECHEDKGNYPSSTCMTPARARSSGNITEKN